MSMQKMVYLVVLLVVGSMCSSVIADSDPDPKQDIESATWGTISKDYPGRNEDDSRILNVAQFHIQIGLQYYYKLHGDWPDSWQHVEDDLLFQVPVRSFIGKTIDPDDSSGGFIGDMYYDAYSTKTSTRGEAHIREMNYLSGPVTVLTHVEPAPTYAELFPQADAAGGITYFSEMLKDEEMMQFMALMGVVANCVRTYDLLYGHAPYSWDEFLDSGLSPIDRDSINPVTGTAFTFNDSPFDIHYEYMENSQAFYLTHLDENGEIPKFGFTY